MPNTGHSQGEVTYTRRQKLEQINHQLERERSTFKSHWRELSEYILPRRSRFFVADQNKGDKRNQKIIDSTATLAVRTLRSGMMGGVTSPARPWFRLTIPDKDLAEFVPVKQWLHTVTTRMTTIFLRSNLYNILPAVYGDLGTFGTGAMLMDQDEEAGIKCYSFPIGSYKIGTDSKGRVRVFWRDFQMTARQIVEKFGQDPEDPRKIDWSNISDHVKSLYQSKNFESRIDIAHVILPNDLYNPRLLDSKYKKYASIYYERGTSGESSNQGFFAAGTQDKFLSEKGYDYFPVLCPRWETTGEDVYGTDCPGMTALGDIKQLQTGEKRGLQAIDKMVNPPMIGPTSLKTQNASILPGDITYVDIRDGMQGFRPAHEVRFDVNSLEVKQQQVRQRISKAFFEDLFLMLANSDRRQITATEIDERREEKLLALGPVLEQLNQDLLDPLIDNTFMIMESLGEIPPPPDEIAGRDLKVEYISIMAQAQKLVGLGGIERFTNYVGGIAGLHPAILDKVDGDQLVDYYGDLTSIPPGIVRSDDEAKGIREQQAQAQAQAQKAQNAAMAAKTAKDLSQADPAGDNALASVIESGAI